MRCISSQIVRSAGALLFAVVLAQSAAAANPPAVHVTMVDDALACKAMLGCFDYVGSWQHVRGKRDGRSNGTSTRSTHTSDVAIFRFNGTRVRIYGVRGPSGGRAGIALDEASTGGRPVDFYAPRLAAHSLIYESPQLAAGVHTLSIVVWGTRNEHGHFYYVNIDGAEYESG